MPIKQARQVRAHHVEEAAKFWSLNPGYKGFRDSTRYDVIINGESYPPKAIVSISRELAKLGDMPPSSFAGAKDGKWHEMLKNLGFRIVPKGLVVTDYQEMGEAVSIPADIEDIEDEYRDNPTVQATMVLARLGQGKYRKELLSLWDDRCAVTGCSILPVLRASHAKPWCKSNDNERLDPNNGIPLVATLDALFDTGLIGFDEKGHMLVSKELRDKELLKDVPNALRKKPTSAQALYLKEHLCSVFQKNDF
ncbi:HNH endonuclease [Massilia sp. Root351]|uniref:HNH endonuclease n=1 Tax=Massilia sp. Root351 TaxID=1736522 RepID=UPI0009E90777|nr:HNH endonuclease signature motif containing protein [Massilia sp. Root351]